MFAVLGNWKSFGSNRCVDDFYQALTIHQHKSTQWGIAFPYPYCQAASTKRQGWVGAQNVSAFGEGAYTGEIHAAMLTDCGCQFALVGHSERRQYFNEPSSQLVDKINALHEAGLTAVYCIGETLEQRDAGQLMQVLQDQLRVLDGLSNPEQLWVAYEPVWAIGTGRAATRQDAQDAHTIIRNALKGSPCHHVPTLYGGSVKPENAAALARETEVGGFLIGGASLKADSFSEIYLQFTQTKSS